MLCDHALAHAVLRDQRHAGVDRVASAGVIATGLPAMRISPSTIRLDAADARARATSGRSRAGRRCRRPRRDAPSGRRFGACARRIRCAARAAASPIAWASPRITSDKPLRALADDVLDHRLDRQLRERRGDHMPAVAQDGGAVGDARDLVHAVRDVDDRDALRPSACAGRRTAARRRGQTARSTARRAPGRWASCEIALTISVSCRWPGPEIADQRARVDVDVQHVEELPRRVARRSGRRSGRSRSWPRGSGRRSAPR